MKTKTIRNPITSLVERGFALHQQLQLLNHEFKQIKDRLKAEAIARPHEYVPLLDQGSSGQQWVAAAPQCECRIVFPAPQLKTELDPAEPLFLTVQALAGDHFTSLFRKVTTFAARDKRSFRNQIFQLLSAEAAPKLLDLCSCPSEPKALWKARPYAKEQP